MIAAKEHSATLEAVADDARSAVLASGGQRMDGALEAVEGVVLPFITI